MLLSVSSLASKLDRVASTSTMNFREGRVDSSGQEISQHQDGVGKAKSEPTVTPPSPDILPAFTVPQLGNARMDHLHASHRVSNSDKALRRQSTMEEQERETYSGVAASPVVALVLPLSLGSIVDVSSREGIELGRSSATARHLRSHSRTGNGSR